MNKNDPKPSFLLLRPSLKIPEFQSVCFEVGWSYLRAFVLRSERQGHPWSYWQALETDLLEAGRCLQP